MMDNFTQKKETNYLRGVGENRKTERKRNGVGVSRIPGHIILSKMSKIREQQKTLHFHDTHYLDKSFEFYPCSCEFKGTLTVKLALRCPDCLMSPQSRIIQMKTKI